MFNLWCTKQGKSCNHENWHNLRDNFAQPQTNLSNEEKTRKKKLIKFVSDIKQIPGPVPVELKLLLKKFWPGPLTVIYNGVSYRMPKNELILGVVRKIGPVYSSSANISDQKPIESIGEACLIFVEHIGKFLLVQSTCKSSGIPSTIYDYDKKKILREGEIPHWKIFS